MPLVCCRTHTMRSNISEKRDSQRYRNSLFEGGVIAVGELSSTCPEGQLARCNFQEDLRLPVSKWHLGSVLSTVLFTASLQAELSITSQSFFLIPSSIAQSSFPVASCQATSFFPPTFLPMPFCSRRLNRLSLTSVAN